MTKGLQYPEDYSECETPENGFIQVEFTALYREIESLRWQRLVYFVLGFAGGLLVFLAYLVVEYVQ